MKTNFKLKQAIVSICLVYSKTKTNAQWLPPVNFTSPTIVCDNSPWKLVFYDGFEGNTINTSKWYPFNTVNLGTNDDWCEGRIGYPGNESIHRDTNVVVNGGTVKLKIMQQTNTWQCATCNVSACTPGFGDTPVTKNYTTGYISSKTTYNNGRIETRLKMPKFKYSWATCWFWGHTINEIDFAESMGGSNGYNWPHIGDRTRNTYNLHAWAPGFNPYLLPNPASIDNSYPNQSWWDWLWNTSTRHKQEDWHTYVCEWDTASIKTYLDGTHVNTIWKYYRYKYVVYFNGLNWVFYLVKVPSECGPISGSWNITYGFPYSNNSQSKLIFSVGMTKLNKVLSSDGELGRMEIDYVKVFQRHPEEDGHTEICAPSTYPVVGSAISGPEILCGSSATYTISPSVSSGTWSYNATYLESSSSSSSSITVASSYPSPFTGAAIEYKYGNGVTGCPIKTVTKLVKCPLSVSTPFGAISAFDNDGNFRIHLISDVYDKRNAGALDNTEISWVVKYNLGTDVFNASTANTFFCKGQYAISPIIKLSKNEKYAIKWDVIIKNGNDSLKFSKFRNSQSQYLQQPNDSNLYFFDAYLPSIASFDTKIMNAFSNKFLTSLESQDTIFIKDEIDKLKMEGLEPYLFFGNSQIMIKPEKNEEQKNYSLVFPNPATKTIQIKFSQNLAKNEFVQYKIYDMEGRIKIEGQIAENQLIDISTFIKGIYI